MWSKVFAWRGVIAVVVLALITLWLGVEQRLGFYIHPRYNIFTLVMAGIGVALFGVSLWALARPHEHDHDTPKRKKGAKLADIGSLVVTMGMVLTVVLLPPTTLSSATAANRSANDQGVVSGVGDIATDGSAELFATLTVREWAGLLVQNQTPSFYAGKPVDVIGIVTPSASSPDVFELTRFVVTCCAVDAQPVSIPVYLPDWQQSWSADTWVRIQGGFAPAPAGTSGAALVLVPVDITTEEVPNEPYLF